MNTKSFSERTSVVFIGDIGFTPDEEKALKSAAKDIVSDLYQEIPVFDQGRWEKKDTFEKVDKLHQVDAKRNPNLCDQMSAPVLKVVYLVDAVDVENWKPVEKAFDEKHFIAHSSFGYFTKTSPSMDDGYCLAETGFMGQKTSFRMGFGHFSEGNAKEGAYFGHRDELTLVLTARQNAELLVQGADGARITCALMDRYRQSYNDLTPNVRAYFHMYRESRSGTSENEIKKAMMPAIEAAADLFNLLDGPISKKADYQALSDALAEYAKALEQIMTPLLDVVNAQHAIVLENELKTFNSEIRQRVAQLQIEGEVDLSKLLEQFD